MRRTSPGAAAPVSLSHSATVRYQHDTLAAAISLAERRPGAKVRVVLAMCLLLVAKVATVYVPVIYGRIVDALAPKDNTALLAIPLGLVIGYGLLRVGSAAFGELRDALFAKVQQRAVRTAARRTFQHLHALSACASISTARPARWRVRSIAARRASSPCCGSPCSTWCRR